MSSFLLCQLEDLGRALVNLCAIVPDGMVCFFPSYSFEESFVNFTKTKNNIFQRLEQKKKVHPRKAKGNFRELSFYRAKQNLSSKRKTLLMIRLVSETRCVLLFFFFFRFSENLAEVLLWMRFCLLTKTPSKRRQCLSSKLPSRQ